MKMSPVIRLLLFPIFIYFTYLAQSHSAQGDLKLKVNHSSRLKALKCKHISGRPTLCTNIMDVGFMVAKSVSLHPNMIGK